MPKELSPAEEIAFLKARLKCAENTIKFLRKDLCKTLAASQAPVRESKPFDLEYEYGLLTANTVLN